MAFPNFFGKQYESASNFLDDLEMAFLVSGRDEEEVKLRAFPLVLKDSAKNWFQNLEPGRKTNWETVKETFLSKYGGLDNPEHLWHRISSLHQATSRTYLTYESQFLRLWAEWEASLAEGERAPNFLKKEKFLAGLFPDLQEKVKGKFPETFEEALQIARVKDRKLEYQAHTSRVEHPQGPTMADERLPPAPTTTPEDPHLELLQRVTNQLDNLSINMVQGVRQQQPQPNNERMPNGPRRQPQRRDYFCYNCGEEGHGMYFCPHPRNFNAQAGRGRQQVTPPRARPPPQIQPQILQNPQMVAQPQVLQRSEAPQPVAEIPPLPNNNEMKASLSGPVRPANSLWDVPSSVDGTPLPLPVQDTHPNHFETKSLQAQRRHEARKRRKNIMEGKLLKRAKGDSQEDCTGLYGNAQYVEFPTPCCADDDGKERLFIEGIEWSDVMNCEEFVCKHGVLASAHSNSIRPLWIKDESGGWLGTTQGSGVVVSEDVPTGHAHINVQQPAAMVDFMHVLSSEDDGMKSEVHSKAKQDVSGDGDVTSAPPAAYSLRQVTPPQFTTKQEVSDAQHTLNNMGDVSSLQHPPSLSSNSSGFSQLTSCVPYEHHAVSKPSHCVEVSIPTCGSSSQLLSWNTGGKVSNEGRYLGDGDSSECIKSCNSSSSEIGNGGARDEQSRLKEEQAEQMQPPVTMPAIYPHPFPVMPLPYPYGVPLPWSLSLPWFLQGSPDQKACAMPLLSQPSVEHSKEAFTNPLGRFPIPYHLPVPGSNYTTPWLPFVPAGAVACTTVENSVSVLSRGELDKSLHPGQIKGQEMSGVGQNLKGEADLVSAFDARMKSTVERSLEDKDVLANFEGECVKAREHVASDEPMEETLKGHGVFTGDGKSSEQGNQPEEGETEFQNHVTVGRQQSLPLATKKVTKKKKVVRFNSIDGERMRECKEAVHSIDGNESITSEQHVKAVECSTQACILPANSDLSSLEVGPQGSHKDGIQNLKLVEGHVNARAADKHDAGDVMHSDNPSVGIEINLENVEGSRAALTHCDKGASKKNASHSATSLLRVITHGSGPLGKTIHGVMYITKEKQARLICVCHGKHMSPLEFVEHSGSTNLSNPERSIVLEPFSCVDHDIPVLA
ncbi:hypothetical protein L7F22_060574 [Adiantum nelumboides]|nr:hypothetical protein [Adiantum nelumboides]